jgi:hypothetical protein
MMTFRRRESKGPFSVYLENRVKQNLESPDQFEARKNPRKLDEIFDFN